MKSKASKFCGGALAVVLALLGLAGPVFFAFLVLLIPVNALADTVVPSSYATSLKPGKSVTITKTVTISAGTPTSAKVDVFFLADTTGSMGGTLAKRPKRSRRHYGRHSPDWEMWPTAWVNIGMWATLLFIG